jgi:hypothetical protein
MHVKTVVRKYNNILSFVVIYYTVGRIFYVSQIMVFGA